MLFFCLFVSFPPVSLVCSFDSVGVLFFFKAMLLFQFRFFSFFGAFFRVFFLIFSFFFLIVVFVLVVILKSGSLESVLASLNYLSLFGKT